MIDLYKLSVAVDKEDGMHAEMRFCAAPNAIYPSYHMSVLVFYPHHSVTA
jgi:hypothetical protein